MRIEQTENFEEMLERVVREESMREVLHEETLKMQRRSRIMRICGYTLAAAAILAVGIFLFGVQGHSELTQMADTYIAALEPDIDAPSKGAEVYGCEEDTYEKVQRAMQLLQTSANNEELAELFREIQSDTLYTSQNLRHQGLYLEALWQLENGDKDRAAALLEESLKKPHLLANKAQELYNKLK